MTRVAQFTLSYCYFLHSCLHKLALLYCLLVLPFATSLQQICFTLLPYYLVADAICSRFVAEFLCSVALPCVVFATYLQQICSVAHYVIASCYSKRFVLGFVKKICYKTVACYTCSTIMCSALLPYYLATQLHCQICALLPYVATNGTCRRFAQHYCLIMNLASLILEAGSLCSIAWSCSRSATAQLAHLLKIDEY